MKQQQAGIIEAKAAIKRADEAVLQGRSIVVFTVFTVFFVNIRLIPKASHTNSLQLPLSFFASVFGMNARELSDNRMTLGTEIKYMCKYCHRH